MAARNISMQIQKSCNPIAMSFAVKSTYTASALMTPTAVSRAINTCCLETAEYIWGLCCQKQVSQAGISNYIPQFTVKCNYLSLPEIPASGNKVFILLWDVITYPCLRYLLLETKSSYYSFDTLKSVQNGRYFADDILQCVFFDENFKQNFNEICS